MANVVAPATPSGLGDMAAVALRMKAYNKTLRTESVLCDVFEKLQGEIRTDPKGITIPDAIFLKLEQPAKGSHSAVVPLLKSLQEKAYFGNDAADRILGKEENLRLKHLTVYYNEIKKSAKFITNAVRGKGVIKEVAGFILKKRNINNVSKDIKD